MGRGPNQWQMQMLLRQTHAASLRVTILLYLVLFSSAVALADIRSIDGSGNNQNNPQWGAANTPLIRLAPTMYGGDGSGDTMLDPLSRPNPRTISNLIAYQGSVDMPNQRNLSNGVWQWGQFLDHDISLTNNSAANGTAAIPVDMDDVLGPAPIPFFRSNFDPMSGTSGTAPRQQINHITAYIDASQVYGSDPERASALRAFDGGRLSMSDGNLLPMNTLGLPNQGGTDASLFLAGDERSNEQVGLTSMHTVFAREHNRLAQLLAERNSAADDEQLYQMARKIVGAEIQNITYNEFLPALLGPYAPNAAAFSYDSTTNPAIANEFSTAFFRLGHSLLSPALYLMRNDGLLSASLDLKNAFFNAEYLREDLDRVGQLLMGLAKGHAQEVDNKVVDDVRNFLFGPPGAGGLDLATLNIQRGRDHGLADYNTLREVYGLPRVTTVSDIASDPDVQNALTTLYGDVNRIDAWVGMLAEDHLPGASVGALATAAIIDQFTRLRDGDRFFYLNDADLWTQEIRSVIDLEVITLSDIIALNTPMSNMPQNFFVVPEPTPMTLSLTGLLGLLIIGGRRRLVCKGRRLGHEPVEVPRGIPGLSVAIVAKPRLVRGLIRRVQSRRRRVAGLDFAP